MDNTPADHVQNVDNDVDQIVDCLNNPVVLRNLLEHFSTRELIKLSVVNKLWNYEARTLMKKRGNLFASVNSSHDHPCQEVLEAFAAVLPKMNVVPFSGISMCIYYMYPDSECSENDEAMEPTVDVISQLLPLIKASFKVIGDWVDYEQCPVLMLIEKVLHSFCGTLEELRLYVDVARDLLAAEVAKNCSFPSLKILKLQEWHDIESHQCYANYMKALVSRSPNLKELHILGDIILMENVTEGSSAVLVYEALMCAPFENISESAISALRLKTMKMYMRDPDFDFERFYRFTPMLLQASCTSTLAELYVDAVLAVPLMCFGICLENVKYLYMQINYRQLERVEPRILSLVKNFDFTRLFPSLNEVRISCENRLELLPAVINAIIEQARINPMRQPMANRAVNIQELGFDGSLSSNSVPFFAEMFPSIRKLDLYIHGEEQIDFGPIWKHWTNLEELKASGRTHDNANLDSIFCGIFPEEVAELREKDDEYLKRVNIVPVMPAITCLKNLRTFKFDYNDDRHRAGGDPTFILTKVSGLIAFARCPGLEVALKTRHAAVYEAMRHMEAYASVVLSR